MGEQESHVVILSAVPMLLNRDEVEGCRWTVFDFARPDTRNRDSLRSDWRGENL